MENYMNPPVDYQWTDRDIINEYQRCQDISDQCKGSDGNPKTE